MRSASLVVASIFLAFDFIPRPATCLSPNPVNRQVIDPIQSPRSVSVYGSGTDECRSSSCSRRQVVLMLQQPLLVSWLWTALPAPRAYSESARSYPILSSSAPESLSLEAGLLEARVSENVLSPPPYGLECPDIFYPAWFAGNWRVKSITKNVEAPCGFALFGGNATYHSARAEIGTTLDYESRFLGVADGSVIADREFNVKSIAKAALGENSVLDIPRATPNKLTCIVAPKGAPSLVQVDLITLNRRQETLSYNRFDCSEVVREIVSPLDKKTKSSAATSPILKEIETASIYTYNDARDEITCMQRSAAFILPSQQSPIAMKMWEASRGRPVDVRFYHVIYTRRG